MNNKVNSIAFCLPYNNYVIEKISKKFINSQFNTICKSKKFLKKIFIKGKNEYHIINLIKIFAKQKSKEIHNLIKSNKTTGGQQVNALQYHFLEKYNNKSNSIFSKINTIEEKLAIILYLFFGKKLFDKNFFLKYTNISKNNTVLSKMFGGTLSMENKILSLDDRRQIVLVTIISNDETKQYCVKICSNKDYIEEYETEIKIYKEIFKNKQANDISKHFVKYISSNKNVSLNQLNPLSFINYKKGHTINISFSDDSVDNSLYHNINIDLSEYIKNNPNQENNSFSYLITEYNPSFLTIFKSIEVVMEQQFSEIYPHINNICIELIRIMSKLSDTIYFYHGDLHYHNVLCNLGGEIKILDLGFSGILKNSNENINKVDNDLVNNYLNLTNFEKEKQNILDKLSKLSEEDIESKDLLEKQIEKLNKDFKNLLLFFDIHRFLVYCIVRIQDIFLKKDEENGIFVFDIDLIINYVLKDSNYHLSTKTITDIFVNKLKVSVKKAIDLIYNEGYDNNINGSPMLISQEIYEQDDLMYSNTESSNDDALLDAVFDNNFLDDNMLLDNKSDDSEKIKRKIMDNEPDTYDKSKRPKNG